MSETLSINPAMSIVAEQQNSMLDRVRSRALLASGAILAATVALAGCSSSDAETEKTTTSEATAVQTTKFEENCGKIDFAQNYADTHYGAPTAPLPKLHEVKDGKQVPFSKDGTSEIIKVAAIKDYRLTATLKTIVDMRSATTPADLSAADTAQNIQNLIKSYEDNTRDVLTDVTEVCDALAPTYLEYTDSFSLSQGVGTQVVFERENAKVSKIGFIPAAVQGQLKGWLLNANYDDPALADRQPQLKELAKSVIITLDGQIILKLVTGPQHLAITLDKNAKTTPVDITIAAGKKVVVSPDVKPGEAPTGSKQAESDETNENQQNASGAAKENDKPASGATGASTNKNETAKENNDGTNKQSDKKDGGKTGGTNGTTGETGTDVGTVPEEKQGPAGGTSPDTGAQPEAAPDGKDNTPSDGGKAGEDKATEQPTTPKEQPTTPAEQPTTPKEQPTTPAEQPTTPKEQPVPVTPVPVTPTPVAEPRPKGKETVPGGPNPDSEFNPERF